MKIIRKRILPLLLSIVMVLTTLTALPLAVYAADRAPDIVVTAADYDIYAPGNVEFAVDLGEDAGAATDIVSVTDTTNSQALGAGDFSFTNPTLSISNAYLSGLSLSVGDTIGFDIEFDDSASTAITVTIRVIDTTPLPVCEIVNGSGPGIHVGYSTIEAALAAVVNGQTIQLITDVTLSSSLSIQNGKSFTFSTNGKTLNFQNQHLFIRSGSKVIFNGCANLVNLQYINITQAGTEAVLNGNLTLNDYLWVGEGAVATINGNITVSGNSALSITDGSVATVHGDITAGNIGAMLSGNSPILTMSGDIYAGYCGLWVSSFGEGWTENALVTINGNIKAGEYGIFARECDGTIITMNGNVISDDIGIYAAHSDTVINVTGNIIADYFGIEAWDEVVIYIIGNIVVSKTDNTDINCGVFAGFGARVTIDGAITAPNYIGFYIPGTDPSEPWYYYVLATDNTTLSLKGGYLQYDDEGNYDLATSFVWVKYNGFVLPLTPETGDIVTLWLLLGTLLVAAFGIGSVFAYRKRLRQV